MVERLRGSGVEVIAGNARRAGIDPAANLARGALALRRRPQCLRGRTDHRAGARHQSGSCRSSPAPTPMPRWSICKRSAPTSPSWASARLRPRWWSMPLEGAPARTKAAAPIRGPMGAVDVPAEHGGIAVGRNPVGARMTDPIDFYLKPSGLLTGAAAASACAAGAGARLAGGSVAFNAAEVIRRNGATRDIAVSGLNALRSCRLRDDVDLSAAIEERLRHHHGSATALRRHCARSSAPDGRGQCHARQLLGRRPLRLARCRHRPRPRAHGRGRRHPGYRRRIDPAGRRHRIDRRGAQPRRSRDRGAGQGRRARLDRYPPRRRHAGSARRRRPHRQ